MPEVRNCRKCKKIFLYVTGAQLCDACKKLEEKEFELVRTFLRDFPGATIQEVSRETGVATQTIYRFLKEGRLEVSDTSPIALQCENCGVRIRSGRFCVACSKRLANEMMNAGRTLKETLRDSSSQGKGQGGLRYMHGERKEGKL